jgi:hypothetical protein
MGKEAFRARRPCAGWRCGSPARRARAPRSAARPTRRPVCGASGGVHRRDYAVPVEVAGDPLMFPRLGRRASDGSFPEASPSSPPLSSTALMNVVKPIMLAAGVPNDQAHPQCCATRSPRFTSLGVSTAPTRWCTSSNCSDTPRSTPHAATCTPATRTSPKACSTGTDRCSTPPPLPEHAATSAVAREALPTLPRELTAPPERPLPLHLRTRCQITCARQPPLGNGTKTRAPGARTPFPSPSGRLLCCARRTGHAGRMSNHA